MIELPIIPDTTLVWYALGPLFVGSITAFIFLFKEWFTTGMILLFISGSVTLIIAGTYVIPIQDEYVKQMEELISSTDCKNLDYIREERHKFNDEVIDEIISRCIPGEHTALLLELRGNN